MSAYVSLGKSQLHKKYFTMTLDLQRAEAIHAEDEFLNLLRYIGSFGSENLGEDYLMDERQIKALIGGIGST